jgi:hypothetical protein
MAVAARPLACMRARTSNTNRSLPGITHPARSRLTTSSDHGDRNLDPRPRQQYTVTSQVLSSAVRLRARGMWATDDSVHTPEVSLASSVYPLVRRTTSSGAIFVLNPICSTSLLLPPRPRAWPPTLQAARRELQQVLEIDANHPTLPVFCGLSQEPAFEPCSATAAESRSVSVLALCMFPSSLILSTHSYNGRGAYAAYR